MTEEKTMIVILEWDGVEIKKLKISRLMNELHLAASSPFPTVISEELPSDATLHKLIFRYKGKKRLCECEKNVIPIFEFEGIE